MRKCKIDLALDALNAKNGKSYPQIGYSYYADIRGDGRPRASRSVYTIINEGCGVSYSPLNGPNPRATLALITAKL